MTDSRLGGFREKWLLKNASQPVTAEELQELNFDEANLLGLFEIVKVALDGWDAAEAGSREARLFDDSVRSTNKSIDRLFTKAGY